MSGTQQPVDKADQSRQVIDKFAFLRATINAAASAEKARVVDKFAFLRDGDVDSGSVEKVSGNDSLCDDLRNLTVRTAAVLITTSSSRRSIGRPSELLPMQALKGEAIDEMKVADRNETVAFDGCNVPRAGILKKHDYPRVSRPNRAHFAPGTISPPPSTEYRARFKAFAAARKSSIEYSASSESIAARREPSPPPWTPRKFNTLKEQILYISTNPSIPPSLAVAISQAALAGRFGD